MFHVDRDSEVDLPKPESPQTTRITHVALHCKSASLGQLFWHSYGRENSYSFVVSVLITVCPWFMEKGLSRSKRPKIYTLFMDYAPTSPKKESL